MSVQECRFSFRHDCSRSPLRWHYSNERGEEIDVCRAHKTYLEQEAREIGRTLPSDRSVLLAEVMSYVMFLGIIALLAVFYIALAYFALLWLMNSFPLPPGGVA